MDKLRITRRNRKGNLTRAFNEMQSLIDGEASLTDIELVVTKAKTRFEQIEKCHDELVELITEEEDFAREQTWITETQREFLSEMLRLKRLMVINDNECNTSNNKDTEVTDSAGVSNVTETNANTGDGEQVVSSDNEPTAIVNTDSTNGDSGLTGLMKTMSLPKPSPTPFEGDPLQYHAFMSTFTNMVAGISDDSLKLNTLMSLCVGKAQEAIQYCVLKSTSEGLDAAKKTLKERFGNVSIIVQAWVARVMNYPKVDSGDLNAYADDLNNGYEALNALGYLHELNNQGSLRQIVSKLPKFLQNRWQRQNYKLKTNGSIPNLADVVKFVKETAKEISDPVFGSVSTNITTSPKPRRNQVNNVSFPHQGGNGPRGERRFVKCWVCQTDNHWPDQCSKLVEMQPEARLEATKQSHVCFACLKVAGRNHRMTNCSRKRPCGIKDGVAECQKSHHRLLHISGTTVRVSQTCLQCTKEPLLNILDVEVPSRNGDMHTASVMLDSGSGGTFIREGFARELGLKGKSVSASISMLGGTVEEFNSHVYDLHLKPVHSPMLHKITALGIGKLNTVAKVDTESIEAMFGMESNTLQRKGGEIDILIGVDHPGLLCGETVKSGGLIAQKSLLGWSVFGGQRSDHMRPRVMNIQLSKPVELSDFWSTEAMGVEVSHVKSESVPDEADDSDIRLLENSCQKLGNRWEVAYPWVKDPVNLADNKGQAAKMLKGLERKLRHSPHAGAYRSEMKEMVNLGFAKKLDQNEERQYKGPVHHIPHHAVIRLEKKSTPVRIVFNSSNRYNGECLNDYWFKGPDFLINLHGVIIRFRENPVAICGDISKMYHQVLIPEVDQHVHRFLWRDMDDTRNPDTFIKTVLTFGDKPAPAMALTALRMTAKENTDMYPAAAKVTKQDTYMDDVCTSVTSVEKGAELIHDMNKVLDTGGFRIKCWVSNREVNGTSTSSEHVKLLGSAAEEEKVLGVKWNPQGDTLEVKVKLKQTGSESITKRKALGVISRVYDPIGFVAPVIVKLKMEMQELWKTGVDWDDELSPDMQEKQLFIELEKINHVKIERCLTPPNASDEANLIVFCDASEKAFGACAYIRWKLNDNTFETRFIAGKSRVAPLKQLTVPRLELQAAVLAARLGLSITEEMTLTCHNKMYLTDSVIVLGWIRKNPGRYKQFVAARVQEIQNKTKIEEWGHVPGKLNPADDISRGVTAENLGARWLHGPSFLKLPESESQVRISRKVNDEREEKQTRICGQIDVDAAPTQVDITNCKTWKSLIEVYRKTVYDEEIPVLDADSEKEIELLLLRRAQQESFSEDYKLLQSGKPVPRGSRLANLDPQFDDQSKLIRVGGRLRRAKNLEIDANPVVLDPAHVITRLLVRQIDDNVFTHSTGVEQVFSHLRRRYWILRGRSLIKSELLKCLDCQRWRKKPQVPTMADLPDCRLRIGQPAFFSTGMDCFGPYAIKIGRRREKRWGLVFKCMTTRAVHLEILASMDADAFIMAFRRFAARRGTPNELFSDCGTNFSGGQRELRDSFKEMSGELQTKLAERQVKFNFNPPSAPHFGGTWEREIKSIKNALKCCLKERVVPEAVLQTVFVEVEGLVNSKPLGYLSSDVVDTDPVTPNMLLIGRRDPVSPAIVINPREEIRSKRQWKHSQVIVDLFWRKFVTEYLPALQVRSKWLTDSPNLEQKDKVLVIDSQAPRGEWLVGEVVKVYPSQDRKVRVADVSVNNKVYKRPVVKLIKLEKFGD